MSKKLLSEAQVRRFQSLASIRPLNEMYNEEEEKPMEEAMHEEEVEEGYYKRDEEPMEAMHEEEEDMPPVGDEAEADEPAEMEADGESVEVEEEMVEKAAAALGDLQALVDALGGEAAGDMDVDDAPAEMPPMDDAPEMDAEEPADDEEEAILELALEGIDYQPSQKEIVKEVAKRVARRLVEAKQAQAKLDRALGRK